MARAISALDSNTAEARQELYERARKALAEQLEVRLSVELDTLLEQQALAAAIDQVEDAAAQETPSLGAGVEANVQFTEVLEARSALERGDYTTALGLFHPLADQGRSFTETMLGDTCLDAAEQGNAVAQTILGFIYATGSSPLNHDEATRWWHRAANQGEPHAQYYLGQAYGAGRGVPLDHVQAFKDLTLASQKNSDVAGNSVEQLWALRLKMSDAELAQAAQLMRKWQPTSEV